MIKKNTEISHLIALCHILDNFDEFDKKLKQLLSTKHSYEVINSLIKITEGEFVFGHLKIKKFYQENVSIIDTIKKYCSLYDFICLNYIKSKSDNESELTFFYRYFLSHNNQLEQIILTLHKMKNLGLADIEFNNSLNTTKTKHELNTNFDRNFIIEYFDNIEIIPNYEQSTVEYTTKGSNYKIILKPSNGKISEYGKRIIVNSLMFDPDNLPNSLTKEEIFDRIVSLKQTKQTECTAIIDSIDLSISIDDLYSQYIATSNVVEKLSSIKNKSELEAILLEIKNNLEKIKSISSENDESITEQGAAIITKKQLQKEKEDYLNNRRLDSIDFD